MPIQFGRLIRKSHESEDGAFHVYRLRCHGGDCLNAVYRGDAPPKALKTVEYKLTGEWEKHPRFGKQFVIKSYERGALKNANPEAGILARSVKKVGQPKDSDRIALIDLVHSAIADPRVPRELNEVYLEALASMALDALSCTKPPDEMEKYLKDAQTCYVTMRREQADREKPELH